MSANLSNILLDKEILLESGTNELEVLVFHVADYTFGINVAKVREVLPATEITSLPLSHHSIRGVFKLRSQVIPCVSLLDHLGIDSTAQRAESTLILTDLNQQQTAFLVDEVDRIYRLSWENILAVPGLGALAQTPVTALARCGDRLIVMLDFEKVLDDVTEQYFRTDAVDNPLGLAREQLRILLAEDSPTVREAITTTLRTSGYTQLRFFENGEEAWQWIEERFQQTGNLEELGDLLICDVEMPQVDGFHLTRRIKQHDKLRQLPVLLYSSMITADNRKKGNAVGADAQVSKPELTRVVQLADELISTAQRENRAAALRRITRTVPPGEPALRAYSYQKAAPAESKARQQPVAPEQAADPDATGQSDRDLATPAEPPHPPAPSAQRPETCQVGAQPAATASGVEQLTAPAPTADAPPPPPGVNPSLWKTFYTELTGREAQLRPLFEQTEAGDRSDAVLNRILRTLHTIKSASMVVPVDQITRCTHMTETLMDAAREDRAKWPQEILRRYVQWLASLVAPDADVDAALAASVHLEAALANTLAAVAAQ